MHALWEDLPQDLRDNPMFQFSADTDFVPAWDRIKLDDIMPAFDYALALTEKNVEKITSNKARPTFKNTVEALEEAGELAGYFMQVFFSLMPGVGEEEKQYNQIMDVMVKRYNATLGNIYRENQKLYERLDNVSKTPAFKVLSPERKMLYEMYKNTFIDAGIGLGPEKKAALDQLRERIGKLELQSQYNMKMAERAYFLLIDDPARLAGLSDFALAAAANKAAEAGAAGKWAFGLDGNTYTSFLRSVEDRGLRQDIWQAWHTQASSGPYDNRATILELIKLQQKEAKLLGYRNVATLNLTYNMALQPAKVASFLSGLRRAAMPTAKKEIAALKAYAKQCDGVALKPWDVPYYQERMKKDLLGFDEEELRPYFELEHVLQATFRHYTKLLNIRCEENADYPVYHPDVRAFNVYKTGSDRKLGVLFMDLHARDGKHPGIAWSSSVLPQGLFEGKVRRPINAIVTKFTPGANGDPTLLTHYDVQVIFHEMGHATHDLLSRCRYPSLSGVNVEGDFVEFPSQIQENWTFEPTVLDDLGRHYKTGERLPERLKKGIQESAKFMRGSRVLEKTMKGWLDLAWYRADPKKITSVEKFEKRAIAPYLLLPAHGSLLSPHFNYIFGGGYEANYYSYQWSQVMEADVFAQFQEKGLYNRKVAATYRKIPEKGGTVAAATLFREFRHRAPNRNNFLRRAGLLGESFNYAAALRPVNDNKPAPVKKMQAGNGPAP